MRRCIVNQRTDIKNHIRGILKTYGIRLGSVGPTKFSETVKVRLDRMDRVVRISIEGLLEVFELLSQKILTMDKELLMASKKDKEVRLLMTIPGIGPVTALTYKAEIFDPSRFKNSRTVGAYIGMTPTQYSSGETQKQGRISRRGSSELRSLLTEAGVVLLTKSQKWSKLKAWGLKLMRKKGIKKASEEVMALDAGVDIVSPLLFGDHGEARSKIYFLKKRPRREPWKFSSLRSVCENL